MAVRVIYIIPDHPHCKPWHEARQRATEALEDIQWFYADEMEKCCYGQKTFDIATDESGQIVFHQINSRLPPAAFTEPGGNEFMDLCNEEARINIQNHKGKAKAYQVRQVLLAIERLEVHYGPEK